MPHVMLQGHLALFFWFLRARVCARAWQFAHHAIRHTARSTESRAPSLPTHRGYGRRHDSPTMRYVILHGHPSLRSEWPPPTRRMCEMKRRRMRSYGAILTRRSALNGRHVLAGRRLEAAREKSAEQSRATGRKYIASARVTYSPGPALTVVPLRTRTRLVR
jgi:hypothetical protein